jgi:hypothetical protein
MATDKARKDVFTIIDKGEGKDAFWLKVGAAWENKDGSWNIVLDALPVNGTLNMRDPYEEKDQRDNDSRERGRSNDRGGGDRGGYRR